MENASPFEVRVDRYLEDLIPDYLNNRQKELEQLSHACRTRNYQVIAELTHRMIGVGTPYGFTHVTEVARQMREAALKRDLTAMNTILAGYTDYVAKVRVVFE